MPLKPEMEVDYDFCKSSQLTPHDLLAWLDLSDTLDVDNLYSWNFFGRNLVIIGNEIHVSCVHKEFDRWANSRDFEFDLSKRGDRRDFIDMVMRERTKI